MKAWIVSIPTNINLELESEVDPTTLELDDLEDLVFATEGKYITLDARQLEYEKAVVLGDPFECL